MGILENIQSILAVVIVVILDLAAIAKAVSVIVKRAKNLQDTTKEEKEAAKAAVIGNLEQIIFGLVTDAEKELGSGTGKLKSAKVAGWIYDKIPDELKALFTPEEIQGMIETGLEAAKEYWNANSKAREYIDSGTATLLTAEVGSIGISTDDAVDDIVQAVGERIGDAIVRAAGSAAETPQNGLNEPDDNSGGQGDVTESAEGTTEGEIPQA